MLVLMLVATRASCSFHKKCEPPSAEKLEKIILVDSLPLLSGNKQTLAPLPEGPARMFIYLDSTGCSCRISYLVDYNLFIEYSELIGKAHFIPFVIASIRTNDSRNVVELLQYSRFNGQIFVDSVGVVCKNNPAMVTDGDWGVYLLDSQGGIARSGNPISNKELWSSYKMAIDSLITGSLFPIKKDTTKS